MKAKDLRERETSDLVELKKTLQKDLFSYRMKNFTNQLEDTSLLRKTKQDIARVELMVWRVVWTRGPCSSARPPGIISRGASPLCGPDIPGGCGARCPANGS